MEELDSLTTESNDKLVKAKENLSSLITEYTVLSDKVNELKAKLSACKTKLLNTTEQVSKSEKTIEDLSNKIEKLPEEAKLISNEIKALESDENIDPSKVQLEIEGIELKIINIKTQIEVSKNTIKDLQRPIVDAQVCNSCHQNISEEHRHNWQLQSDSKILELNANRSILEKEEISLKSLKTDAGFCLLREIAWNKSRKARL